MIITCDFALDHIVDLCHHQFIDNFQKTIVMIHFDYDWQNRFYNLNTIYLTFNTFNINVGMLVFTFIILNVVA